MSSGVIKDVMVRHVRTRYPLKIGSTLIPKGEVGRLATMEEAMRKLPKLMVRSNSTQISVIFRNLDACIVHIDQVEIL